MRLKHYIAETQFLSEGKAQITKKYVDTGKITQFDVNRLVSALKQFKRGNDKFINTYLDWLLHEIYRLQQIKAYGNIDFARTMDRSIMLLFDAALLYQYLFSRKIVKSLEYSKSKTMHAIGWHDYLIDILETYAKKQKATGLGGNYKQVYNKNGFEIFACIDQEAVNSIGSSANWCIRRQEQYWNEYGGEYNFFVVIDHHRRKTLPNGREDTFRKVCVQLSKANSDDITVWDYTDRNMDLNGYIENAVDLASVEATRDLKRTIQNLESFDSEYDMEDNKLREEARKEYDQLIDDMGEWYDEYSTNIEKLHKEIEQRMENLINKKREEGEYESAEEIEGWLNDEQYADFYDAYEDGYYAEANDGCEPATYVTVGTTLEEWWRDVGVTESDMKRAIDGSVRYDNAKDFFALPNPHNE